MKKKWIANLEDIDDKFLLEAQPEKEQIKVEKTTKKVVKWRIAALVASFVLAVTLMYLFVPLKGTSVNISKYKNSKYYGVISKINTLTYEPPMYKNNFEKIFDGLFAKKANGSLGSTGMPGADFGSDQVAGSVIEGPKYQEITDNQVENVIEADKIKRSTEYVYYLSGKTVLVYSIAKDSTQKVGEFTISLNGNATIESDKAEMYLSSDCKTLTVILPFEKTLKQGEYFVQQNEVGVYALNVADPKNIAASYSFSVSGGYVSSRLIGGKLALITSKVIKLDKIDYSINETFLPYYGNGENRQTFEPSDIICPEEISAVRYKIVSLIDLEGYKTLATKAYMSASDTVYVSEENVYLTIENYETKEVEGLTYSAPKTEICRLNIDAGLSNAGEYEVKGLLNDRFSLDEYEGHLRVVTTVAEAVQIEGRMLIATNASLFVIPLDEPKNVKSVECFAPWRESVHSVRFNKNIAFVCTAIKFTDPVFKFDLSDYSAISYTSTTEIEGYSSSLIDMGEALVGIGLDNNRDFKLELYKESAGEVISLDKLVIDGSYSTEYKSYYIDRQNGYIGMAISEHSNKDNNYEGKCYYKLFKISGGKIEVALSLPLEGTLGYHRGFVADGYLYAFCGQNFVVSAV